MGLTNVQMLYDLASPVRAQIELTEPGCGGDCFNCPVDAGNTKANFKFELLTQIVDECCRFEVMRLAFSAPRLLARLREIAPIVERASRGGIVVSLTTCSFGDEELSEETVEILFDIGVDKIEFYLQGEVQARLVHFLEQCNLRTIRPELRLVVNDDNVLQVAETARKYRDLTKLSLNPVGLVLIRSRNCTQLRVLLDQAKTISRFLDTVIEPPVPPCLNDSQEVATFCSAGVSGCLIDVNGNMYPCPMLRVPSANIFEDGLTLAWRKLSLYMRQIVPAYTPCRSCAIMGICKGACPAFSYHAYRDPSQGDPSLRLFEDCIIAKQ